MVGLIYLGVYLITATVAGDQCYQGWVYYSGSCYGYSDTQVSWSEAAKLCQMYHGNLAEIDSPEENEFVKALVSPKQADKIWLGGTDLFNEGTWEWMSNGRRSFNFTDWHAGQPSDHETNGQDCLDMIQNYKYSWADDSCSSNHNFVCESPPLEPIEE